MEKRTQVLAEMMTTEKTFEVVGPGSVTEASNRDTRLVDIAL